MELIIEPGRAARHYWRDLWRYRELLYVLTARDLAVRYKQTAIGVAWALVRPVLTLVVFVAFRRLVRAQPAGVPEAVLVFAAVLPWQLFSAALSDASMSLIGSTNLIAKVYFPRLLIPFAAAVTALSDFLIMLGLLAVLMAWYGLWPAWPLLLLPVFLAGALALAVGVGLFFAALNVEYRDFRYVVPFIVQVGLFVSPIAFTTEQMPESWRGLYILNPLVGIIDGFRWSILGGRTPLDPQAVLWSCAASAAALALGIWYFRRMERGFADVI